MRVRPAEETNGRESFRERAPEIVASLRQPITDFEAMRGVMVTPPYPAAGTLRRHQRCESPH